MGKLEAVNRMTDNTMNKRKRTNNDLQIVFYKKRYISVQQLYF